MIRYIGPYIGESDLIWLTMGFYGSISHKLLNLNASQQAARIERHACALAALSAAQACEALAGATSMASSGAFKGFDPRKVMKRTLSINET